MRRFCLIHFKNYFRRIRPSREEPKNAVCISNRKKSKCHLSRWVTDSYVDMRIRQPDSSGTHRTVHLAVGPHERLQKKCASADIKCGCEASLCTGGPHSCWGLRRTHAGTFRTGSINEFAKSGCKEGG